MEPSKATKSFRLPDGGEVTLTVERDWIDVRTSVQPTKVDPSWSWTDPAGHRHDASLKTAHWVVVYTYYCEDCRDEHDRSELRCRLCDVEVKPRRLPDHSQPEYVPGLGLGTLEVVRLGRRTLYHLNSERLEQAVPLEGEAFAVWVATVETDGEILADEITGVSGR